MRTTTRALVAVPAVLLSVAAAGCGSDQGSTASGGTTGGHASTRTVDVAMTDNAFAPTAITVATGETVTFRFTNQGAVTHEAVLGDDAAQLAHHQQMPGTTSMGNGSMGSTPTGNGSMGNGSMGNGSMGTTATTNGKMSSDHHGNAGGAGTMPGGSDAVTVAPGQTGEITHTFDRAGTLVIGCHEPGHWEAGMKATVTVS